MEPKEAIEILENETGYTVIAEDCDKETVIEAIHMALEALKRNL